jgi:hypothetical protein
MFAGFGDSDDRYVHRFNPRKLCHAVFSSTGMIGPVYGQHDALRAVPTANDHHRRWGRMHEILGRAP